MCSLWRESEYQYPSEPLFVAKPSGTDEDEGVVLVPVVETRSDYPHLLVVLDAKTFEEIARIETQEPIPNALHGVFIRDGFKNY